MAVHGLPWPAMAGQCRCYWPGNTKRRIKKTKTNTIEDEKITNSKDEDEDNYEKTKTN